MTIEFEIVPQEVKIHSLHSEDVVVNKIYKIFSYQDKKYLELITCTKKEMINLMGALQDWFIEEQGTDSVDKK